MQLLAEVPKKNLSGIESKELKKRLDKGEICDIIGCHYLREVSKSCRFLISKDGTVLMRFKSAIEPNNPELIASIEHALSS